MSEHTPNPVVALEPLNRDALIQVLTAVSEHSFTGILLLDCHGEAVFMNQRFQEMWGLPAELVGPSSGDERRAYLSTLVTDPQRFALLHEVAPREGMQLREAEVTLKDGRTLIASSIPVRNATDSFQGQLLMYWDQTSLRDAEQERNFFQAHDSVTGLLNRSTMWHTVEHLLGTGDGSMRYALIALRLTRFSLIQQRYGPAFADEVLRACTTTITQFVGLHTPVSRHDSAEFLVLVPHSESLSVVDQATLLVDELSKEYTIEKVPILLHPQAGVSRYPDDGTSANDLVSAALLALERSVEAGPSRVTTYREDYGKLADERALIEEELNNASRGHGLQLHYQPIYDLRTQQLAGFECLLRWQSQKLGHVSPEVFLPYAEETGLILPIGEWVLHSACAQLAAWAQAGLEVVPLSVNVSASQILAGNFVETVAGTLRSTGCSPFMLHLELTETALATNLQQVSHTLQQLRAMGIKISIDDFGTGFSSLSYLKHFRVDTVKIDRSFTKGIGVSREENALVQGVVSLGQALGLTVLAEGVETREQLDFLRYSRCDQVQGFYLRRPMNVAQIGKLLEYEQFALNLDGAR